MASNFAAASLSNPTYSVYSISNFNGVDYTTTPTLVDESRAIEISNYIPIGNSLIKRNGFELIMPALETQKFIELRKIKKMGDEYYFGIIDNSDREDNSFSIFLGNELTITGKDTFKTIDFEKRNKYDRHFVVEYDNRIFVLLDGNYYCWDKNTEFTIENFKTSKDFAYIPTTYVGLEPFKNTVFRGEIDITEEYDVNYLMSEKLNLLTPKFNVEIMIKASKGFGELEESKSYSDDYYYDLSGLLGEDQSIELANDQTCVFSDYGIEENGITIENGKYLKIRKIITTDVKEPKRNKLVLTLQKTGSGYDANFVTNMTFGISYGFNNNQDVLFLSGNERYPNIDIHSGYTGLERWKDYTYFPDDSYQAFGSSNTAIIGYGILNNGSMAVFKEYSNDNKTNLFFRNGNVQTYTDDFGFTQVDITYPITLSGINLETTKKDKIIQFDGNLFVNNASGLYRVDLGQTTSSNTYEAKEVSYFIRENLKKDSEGDFVVKNNKLYLSRNDINGKIRVYVADKDRYSYKDGYKIYEWWCLDGVEAYNFFDVDDEIYFSNYSGLCKFNKEYSDNYFLVNEQNGTIGLSKDFYMTFNKDDKFSKQLITKEDYDNFLKYGRVKFYKDISTEYFVDFCAIKNPIIEFTQGTLYIQIEDNYTIYDIFKGNEEKLINKKIAFNNFRLQISKITYSEEQIIVNYTDIENKPYDNIGDRLYISLDALNEIVDFTISEIYAFFDNGLIPYSKCVLEDDKWVYFDDEHGKLHEMPYEQNFATIKLRTRYGDLDFKNFYKLDCVTRLEIGRASIFLLLQVYYTKPIQAHWYGKWENLGRLDVLKSANTIHFVPDFRFDGETRVGYRTSKTDIGYNSVVAPQGLDFQDIDFNYFAFGNKDVAKTYSSKKKIKNFSFIQLKIYSNDDRASSMVSISFRYKTTKINKGVK